MDIFSHCEIPLRSLSELLCCLFMAAAVAFSFNLSSACVAAYCFLASQARRLGLRFSAFQSTAEHEKTMKGQHRFYASTVYSLQKFLTIEKRSSRRNGMPSRNLHSSVMQTKKFLGSSQGCSLIWIVWKRLEAHGSKVSIGVRFAARADCCFTDSCHRTSQVTALHSAAVSARSNEPPWW